VFYHSLEEIDSRRNQELEIALSNALILNDPNLSIAAYKKKISERRREVFSEAFEQYILKLLRNLTYSEEAFSYEAYASSAFWMLTIGYDMAFALNLINKMPTSPSHFMQQMRENPIFKETNFFVDIAEFVGLEHVIASSYRKIFSVVDTFKKLADFYRFEELPPTEFPRTKIFLSDNRIEELSRKCEYANSQNMPLNSYIISTKWFIDSIIELYEIICLMEKTSQFKPKIVEELEKRRNVTGASVSIPDSILLEMDPPSLRKKIDNAKKALYWLKRNKVQSL
jgi:hypothetical protein